MTTITIGKHEGRNIGFDLNVLLRTRLLIQANSGGGKSLTLRTLAEQAFGKVQIIIIDPAGEFPSLRERYDYILVGEHGETEANVRTAGMLAERLLELKASAVCDLYGLKPDQRHIWVKNFLESTMNAQKKLWHPVFFIVDEAHKFMPEKSEGESVAKPAMLSLCSDGRKYGFCPILATQRLAKLDKSGASELLNVMIGPTFIDVDLERAHKALGIVRTDWGKFDEQMKTVEPGNFWVLGRAISKSRILVHVNLPSTTHPEPGSAQAAEPPPPPEKIRALLPKLSDLPKEVEHKIQTETDLRKKISELQGQLNARPTVTIPETKVVEIKTAVFQNGEIERLEKVAAVLEHLGFNITEPVKELKTAIQDAKTLNSQPKLQTRPVPFKPTGEFHRPEPSRLADTESRIAIGHLNILRACGQYPEGLQRDQLTVLTGYKRSSRDAYLKELIKRGLVIANGKTITITDAGFQVLGPNFEPLPTGDRLRAYWLSKLPEGERRILEFLISVYPNDTGRDDINETINYKRSTRDAYLKKMVSKKIVEITSPARVRASSNLFD